MANYQVTWIPKSGLVTPLQSDTIFGHFCWAYSMLKGEEALTSLLKEMKHNPSALLLSSAFPKGFYPFPAVALTLEDWKNIAASSEMNLEDITKLCKHINWITKDEWDNRVNDFDIVNIVIKAVNNSKVETSKGTLINWDETPLHVDPLYYASEPQAVTVIEKKASINRLTGTTSAETANLYGTEVEYFAREVEFESYVQTDYLSKNDLEEIFDVIANSGFGKKKSSGRGQFQIKIDEITPVTADAPNAWMILSNVVPHKDDPIDCSYRGFTKFGKLGGTYAIDPNYSPYKKPLFMLQPGTVFWGETSPVGTLVENIHPDNSAIVQYARAFALPFSFKGTR